MKFLTESECGHWLRERAVDYQAPSSAGREGFITLPAHSLGGAFAVPTDATTQVSVAWLLSSIDVGSQALLLITTWNTSGAGHEYDAMAAVRQAMGESRDVGESPGCLFDLSKPTERVIVANMVLLMTAFNWEGWIVSADASSVVWLADEVVEWCTCRQSDHDQLKAGLEAMNIAEGSRPWHVLRGSTRG